MGSLPAGLKARRFIFVVLIHPFILQALRTIHTIIGNVVGNPHEAKFRQVKKNNAAFDRRVGSGACCLTRWCGLCCALHAHRIHPSIHPFIASHAQSPARAPSCGPPALGTRARRGT